MKQFVPTFHQTKDVELTSHLNEQFYAIAESIRSAHQYEPTNRIPTKPAVGLTVYFEKALGGTPINGEGLWIFKSTGWTQVV